MQDFQFKKEQEQSKIHTTFDETGKMKINNNQIHYWAGRRVNGDRNGFNKIDDIQAKWSEQLYTGGCFNPLK